MELVFAKFDSRRHLWAAAAQATAMLDALGSLALASSKTGYSRAKILDCPPDGRPSIHVVQGKHPSVDQTHSGGEFIPNDLSLGAQSSNPEGAPTSRVLLLSGPNMVCSSRKLWVGVISLSVRFLIAVDLVFTGRQINVAATNLSHGDPRSSWFLCAG